MREIGAGGPGKRQSTPPLADIKDFQDTATDPSRSKARLCIKVSLDASMKLSVGCAAASEVL